MKVEEEGHSTEITCMLFIDPHPCLVTADADANICVWGVRPYYPKYHVLYRCRIPRTPTPYYSRYTNFFFFLIYRCLVPKNFKTTRCLVGLTYW